MRDGLTIDLTQAAFLRELEFMQGAEFSEEAEWRIVQSQPLYMKRRTGKKRTMALSSFRDTWGREDSPIRVSVDVAPEDVFQIYCPQEQLGTLIDALRAADLFAAYAEHCTPYSSALEELDP